MSDTGMESSFDELQSSFDGVLGSLDGMYGCFGLITQSFSGVSEG